MIYGTGVDLVDITRMEKVIHRWGDRFIRRVFTQDEIKICHGRLNPVSAFSSRFAAKEAFSKAVGTGMRKGVRWRDIEIFHYDGGKPGLRLHGKALRICEENHINGFHVSLSDEGGFSMAMVILEK